MIPCEFVLFASNVEHISMSWAALVFLGVYGASVIATTV
jgi:hypothetical protein